jgi:DNA-directed RNA polymerase specialized sigma24 family protein
MHDRTDHFPPSVPGGQRIARQKPDRIAPVSPAISSRVTEEPDDEHAPTTFDPLSPDIYERLRRFDLERSLDRRRRHDSQLARLVELRCFESMTITEIALMLEVSTRTVERGWRFARLWLCRELDPNS